MFEFPGAVVLGAAPFVLGSIVLTIVSHMESLIPFAFPRSARSCATSASSSATRELAVFCPTPGRVVAPDWELKK